jgi:hypothetical protein
LILVCKCLLDSGCCGDEGARKEREGTRGGGSENGKTIEREWSLDERDMEVMVVITHIVCSEEKEKREKRKKRKRMLRGSDRIPILKA